MNAVETRKFIAPEILSGTDVRFWAASYLKGMNLKRVLLVTDKNLIKYAWFDDIIKTLEKGAIDYVIYNAISPNSPDPEVMTGLETYSENKCQGILAIGGGSVLDSAKGIGIVYSNHKHILNFEGVDKIKVPTPPIICIPTTSGTSSDVSQFAIIRDMSRLVKIAIVSKSLVPDVTLIDPVVTMSMDQQLTACTGMDALTHAIEAYVSNGNSPLTDLHALKAIQLIKENLVETYNDLNSEYLRYQMMLASLYAGLAFSNASLGAVHALAHSIGGYFNTPHGETNALLLQYVIPFNYPACPERFDQITSALGVDISRLSASERSNALVRVISDLKKQLNLDYSLSLRGVRINDTPLLANNANLDACMITNPRKTNIDDLKSILKEAI